MIDSQPCSEDYDYVIAWCMAVMLTDCNDED